MSLALHSPTLLDRIVAVRIECAPRPRVFMYEPHFWVQASILTECIGDLCMPVLVWSGDQRVLLELELGKRTSVDTNPKSEKKASIVQRTLLDEMRHGEGLPAYSFIEAISVGCDEQQAKEISQRAAAIGATFAGISSATESICHTERNQRLIDCHFRFCFAMQNQCRRLVAAMSPTAMHPHELALMLVGNVCALPCLNQFFDLAEVLRFGRSFLCAYAGVTENIFQESPQRNSRLIKFRQYCSDAARFPDFPVFAKEIDEIANRYGFQRSRLGIFSQLHWALNHCGVSLSQELSIVNAAAESAEV